MNKYWDKTYEFSKKFRKIHVLLIGLLLGVLIFGTYRFITYSSDHTHYHANFAVYINGERETFEGAGYYEELVACGHHGEISPRERTHMHQPENSVVHVHHEGVSWGHFFENIGYSVGPKHLSDGNRVYVEDDSTEIRYFLNGKKVPNIANTKLGDLDRLLVIVDDMPDEEALKLYEEIVPKNAVEFNESSDPGSCSSGSSHPIKDRFNNIF